MDQKNLLKILTKAFDAGVVSSQEEKEAIIRSLLAEFHHKVFRYYTLTDLYRLPKGKKIIHLIEGEGVVVNNSIEFGNCVVCFTPERADFWSYPMAEK